MVFTYLDKQNIWDKFCGTYEAIYDRLGEFDKWYTNKFKDPSDLQSEWKKYLRVVLDSMVARAKIDFDIFYQNRK